MSDGIIDFGEYARRKQEESRPARSMFAIWGGEGERSRFALPLWRAAGLAGGSRALLLWEGTKAADRPVPLVVLDLAEEPARTATSSDWVREIREAPVAPALTLGADSLAVFLGEEEERRYYLVVDELAEDADESLRVDDLFFLAGECAGLLMHRALGEGGEP